MNDEPIVWASRVFRKMPLGFDVEIFSSDRKAALDELKKIKFGRPVFLSDRLVKALGAVGFAKEMQPLKCRVSSQPQRLSTT